MLDERPEEVSEPPVEELEPGGAAGAEPVGAETKLVPFWGDTTPEKGYEIIAKIGEDFARH